MTRRATVPSPSLPASLPQQGAALARTPSLVHHACAEDFLAAAMPFLERSRASNSGLISWTRALAQEGDDASASHVLITVHRGGRVVGVGLRRDEGPLVVNESEPAAARAIAAALAHDGIALPGVIGERAACHAFVDAWEKHAAAASRLRFHLRNYTLERLRPPPAAPGHARPARRDEAQWIIEWLVAFMVEARVPDDPSRVRVTTGKRIGDRRLWVWEDGVPRALVGFFRTGQGETRIAPVYTDPASRGRGYAGSLLAAVIDIERADDTHAFNLTADLANAASNRLYRRLGFRAVGDQYHYDLLSPAAAPVAQA